MTTLPATQPAESALLDKEAVAKLMKVSTRHIDRMVKCGRIPPPLKLGRLPRWPRAAFHEWLNAGCPHVTPAAHTTSGTN